MKIYANNSWSVLVQPERGVRRLTRVGSSARDGPAGEPCTGAAVDWCSVR